MTTLGAALLLVAPGIVRAQGGRAGRGALGLDGEGCYRVTHPAFLPGIRIDTVLIHATGDSVGPGRFGGVVRGLLPNAGAVGLSELVDSNGTPLATPGWFVSHDSLHLVWADGIFNMIQVDLRVVGDSVAGTLTYISDGVVPDPPRVRVTGRRVSCAANRERQ